MEEKIPEIYWICKACAWDIGGSIPKKNRSTIRQAKCDVCKTVRMVTQPWDYKLNRDGSKQ